MTTVISPALGAGVLYTQGGVGATPGYNAIDERRANGGVDRAEGVSTYGSFRVSQRSAGANMSVDVNMDEGAYVRGDAVSLQGLYYVPPHSATLNEAIAAADGSNPRLDQVVLEVKDHQHDASGSSTAQIRVVAGTATAGATLDNRNGAAALPSSALLLADVLVATSDTSITDAEIRDRRAFIAGVPPVTTDVDMVPLIPVAAAIDGFEAGASGDVSDLEQAAALCRLERRIIGATRIRWKYAHNSGAAATGNYVLAIYDASGRKIIDTGTVAFTGAAGSIQARSETITATTFEPGLYYAFWGIDTSAGSMRSHGVRIANDAGAIALWPIAPNMGYRANSGGVTPPTTLASLTDVGASTSPTSSAVPLIALSVG